MKKMLFIPFVVVQVLLLLAMSIYYYTIDDTGEIIQLRAAPVDPYDLFYGDYASLRYDIETVPAKNWQGETDPENNVKVYVLLEEQADGIYELVSAGQTRMEPLEKQAVLVGKLEYHNDYEATYELDFGLNRYFIEENTGEQFNNRTSPMIVTVAVSDWGPSKIISVE